MMLFTCFLQGLVRLFARLAHDTIGYIDWSPHVSMVSLYWYMYIHLYLYLYFDICIILLSLAQITVIFLCII